MRNLLFSSLLSALNAQIGQAAEKLGRTKDGTKVTKETIQLLASQNELEGAQLAGAYLRGVCLKCACLAKADFSGADFIKIEFNKSKIKFATEPS